MHLTDLRGALPEVLSYILAFAGVTVFFLGACAVYLDIYRYDSGKVALTKRLPLPKTSSHMAFLPDSSLVPLAYGSRPTAIMCWWA